MDGGVDRSLQSSVSFVSSKHDCSITLTMFITVTVNEK